MFCSHDWVIKTDKILSAPLDGVHSFETNERVKSLDIPYWLFKKTHIFIMTCRKCGKVYRSVVTNLP